MAVWPTILRKFTYKSECLKKKFNTIQWPNRQINVSFTNYSDKSNLKTIFIYKTTKMSATDEPACKRLRLNEPSSSSSDDQKAADQQSNHAHEDQPSNSLLRLNDDCFRHIFGYCDKEDWCRLADVCTRLQLIAEQSFSKWINSTTANSTNRCFVESSLNSAIWQHQLYVRTKSLPINKSKSWWSVSDFLQMHFQI